MSKIIGNAVLLFVDEQAIGCTTSATLNITGTEIETTCKDDNGAYSSVIGTDEWTMEIAGNWETTSTFGVPQLASIKYNKTLVGVKMSVVNTSTGSDLSGGLYFQGYANMTDFNIDAPLNGAATISATFKGSGAWSYGTTT